jgi:hypothetical protein
MRALTTTTMHREISNMRKALLVICGATLAIAFAPLPVIAQPAPDGAYVAHRAHNHVPPRRVRRSEGQIACGTYGCVRIPPNCHPQQSFDWEGNPTGSDAIVCR